MHIILGILGAIVTILVLLNRLAEAGIDLGGLNPFSARRRRKWQQKFEGNPLFAVEDPIDVAAILVVATANIDGIITAEERAVILGMFESDFHLSQKQATDLLGSSAHLLGDGSALKDQLEGFLVRSGVKFTNNQVESMLSMMESVTAVDGSASSDQLQFIEDVRAAISKPVASDTAWGK